MKELDSKQKAFALYLAEVLEAKGPKELDTKIQNLSQDELNQLTTSFDTIYEQQMDAQAILAKAGAKLNYIKKLNNRCPEGYEPQKFQAGGKTCTKCVPAQQKTIGESAWLKKGSKVVSDIKSEMCSGGKMKCGGKTGKSTMKKKGEEGTKLQKNKKMEKGDKMLPKKKSEPVKEKTPPDPGAGVVEYDGKRKEYSGHDGKGKSLPVDKKTGAKKPLPKKNQQGGNIFYTRQKRNEGVYVDAPKGSYSISEELRGDGINDHTNVTRAIQVAPGGKRDTVYFDLNSNWSPEYQAKLKQGFEQRLRSKRTIPAAQGPANYTQDPEWIEQARQQQNYLDRSRVNLRR